MIRPTRVTILIGSPLCLALAGCVGMKPVDLGPKTIPAIGDRQISVSSGRPGEESIIRSATASPMLDARDARRISGRVIDHRGQPVSGATVRLADSALASGQITDVITDEAGGFTVRGLRASTPYTVIATLDLGGETRVARARFLSGETQARILMEPGDQTSAPPESDEFVTQRRRPPVESQPKVVDTRLPAPPKGRWIFLDESDQVVANVPTRTQDDGVKRVSRSPSANSDEVDEDTVPAAAKRKPVNADWRSGEEPRSRTTRDASIRAVSYFPDEENPLPPAIERKAFVYEEFDEGEDESRERFAAASRRPPRTVAEPERLSEELVPITEVPSAEDLRENYAGNDARPSRSAQARRSSTERRTGGYYSDAPSAGSMRVEDIEEVNRIIRERRARERARAGLDSEVNDLAEDESPTWDQAARPVRPEPAPRTDRTISRTNRSTESTILSSDLSQTAAAARRTSQSSAAVSRGLERPLDQRESIERSLRSKDTTSSLGRFDSDIAVSDQDRIDRLKASGAANQSAFNGETPRTSNEWINRLAGSLPWGKKSSAFDAAIANGVYCDFDDANQRLVDFELPDIKGRPTRFSQMPADLTLMVFWGTWCKPCHEAMPHLVELQKRLAADNVQILGISYEEGSPAERQEKVARAVERYDINFPLLMGGMKGAEACPVRKALSIRVYPTLVLVDRDGRVLWRDQGVTPATFGRLDRVLAAHLQDLDTRNLADRGETTRR